MENLEAQLPGFDLTLYILEGIHPVLMTGSIYTSHVIELFKQRPYTILQRHVTQISVAVIE